MTAPSRLPQRHPGTHLPAAAYRAIGRAKVVYSDSRWATDLDAVEALREALKRWQPRG